MPRTVPLLGEINNSSMSSYGSLPFSTKEEEKIGNQLGWFSGVFVPTMLGIFGVVTFLRMGWVVGQVSIKRITLMYIIHIIMRRVFLTPPFHPDISLD